MSDRYERRMADWGDTLTTQAWRKRYGHTFKGDGWYLLDIDSHPAACLVMLADSDRLAVRVATNGWFVKDEAEASALMREIADQFPVREQDF